MKVFLLGVILSFNVYFFVKFECSLSVSFFVGVFNGVNFFICDEMWSEVEFNFGMSCISNGGIDCVILWFFYKIL